MIKTNFIYLNYIFVFLILIIFLTNNIVFRLILITNIFKASELKQDGPVEEGGMIKVR